jgi:hypothetical protein
MGKSELIPSSFAGVKTIDYAWHTEKIRPFIFQEAVYCSFMDLRSSA